MVEGEAFDFTYFRDDDGDGGQFDCQNGDNSADVYYQFTTDRDGTWTVSTCGLVTNFDTVISIHTDCPPESFSVICNDDDPNCFPFSTVSLEALAFETYLVRVAGYFGAEGDFSLVLTGPPGVAV